MTAAHHLFFNHSYLTAYTYFLFFKLCLLLMLNVSYLSDEEPDFITFSNQHLSSYDNADPDINFSNGSSKTACRYFTTESLNTLVTEKDISVEDSLSFFHLNIRRLPKHYDDLIDYLSLFSIQFDNCLNRNLVEK